MAPLCAPRRRTKPLSVIDARGEAERMVGERVVLFRLGSTICAMDAARVREILPLPRLRRPPAAPALLLGFFDLAGQMVPALDLAALLGLRPALQGVDACDVHAHLVLTAMSDGAAVALLVDRALDIVELDAAQMKAVDPAETMNGCVEGELSRDGDLVHVLDVDRLLMAQERERLDHFAARAGERLAEWA